VIGGLFGASTASPGRSLRLRWGTEKPEDITTLIRLCAAAFLALIAAPTAALAQDWPQAGKPVRIVNPFPPGGTADGLSRAIAARLSPEIGVPVVVENKPGATTMVAVNELRKSPPDGHTILYTITSTTSQLPNLVSPPPFDIGRDFTPLGLLAFNALVLVANPKAPFASVAELIAYAKAHPGKLNYGSFGTASNPHIMGELLNKAAGIQMTHIAYKGSAESARAVISGEVDLAFDSPVTAINNRRAGLVKALAIAGPRRLPVIGDVPTMAEAGIAGFETPGVEELLGPAGMKRPLADKMNATLMRVVRSPEVSALYINNGFQLVASTVDEHARLMQENMKAWGEVIRRAGIKLEQ